MVQCAKNMRDEIEDDVMILSMQVGLQLLKANFRIYHKKDVLAWLHNSQ